jgi:hypothetical protein
MRQSRDSRHGCRLDEPNVPVFDDAALWKSDNPRFGLVRVVVSDGQYSIVLGDQNSDYRGGEDRKS